MGDAAGQPAHRLQPVERSQVLLAGPERQLGPLPLGDVGDDGDEAEHLAVRPQLGRVGAVHVVPADLLVGDLDLELDRRSLQHLIHVGTETLVGLASDHVPEILADHLLRREPEADGVGLVDEPEAALGVEVGDVGRRRVGDEPDVGAGPVELSLGPLPLGDVLGDAEEAGRLAPGPAHQGGGDVHPDLAAVLPPPQPLAAVVSALHHLAQIGASRSGSSSG